MKELQSPTPHLREAATSAAKRIVAMSQADRRVSQEESAMSQYILSATANPDNYWRDMYDRREAQLKACEARLSEIAPKLPETMPDVHDTLIDAERYRWFREQGSENKVAIAEMSGDEGHILDHFIDKGRCGL